MDQYLSAVIIAGMTGIFSIITLIIQKKQDRIVNKIDEQTMFIEKEKGLKQKLVKQEKERERIIQQIMILILDTNLHILKGNQSAGSIIIDPTVFEKSENLKDSYTKVTDSIKELSKEYEMVIDMTNVFQKELEKAQIKK